MEPSILISTKKILGVAESYRAFDLDILTHINATFSVLSQLGIGPEDGFFIEDELAVWGDFSVVNNVVVVPPNQLALVRTYLFLKVRMLFDPPTTSFLIEATKSQIEEIEWRLNVLREHALPDPVEEVDEI